MARLNTTLKPGYSPRMVITLANQAIQEAGAGADAAHEVEHALAEAYREECDKVASDPNSWPPNANHLLSALEMWLGAHPEFKVSRSADKYLRLSGKRSAEGPEAPCAFIIMTTPTSSFRGSRNQQGDQVSGRKSQRVLLLRHGRAGAQGPRKLEAGS